MPYFVMKDNQNEEKFMVVEKIKAKKIVRKRDLEYKDAVKIVRAQDLDADQETE